MNTSLIISIIILICVFIVYLIALYQRMKYLNANCNFSGQGILKNLFSNKLNNRREHHRVDHGRREYRRDHHLDHRLDHRRDHHLDHHRDHRRDHRGDDHINRQPVNYVVQDDNNQKNMFASPLTPAQVDYCAKLNVHSPKVCEALMGKANL